LGDLSYVKQLGDQDIARGLPPLTYQSYLEILLSAYSTYDKNIGVPVKQKRAVYETMLDEVNIDESRNDRDNDRFEVFKVHTDVTDILLYKSNVNRFGSSRNDLKSKA
jgi:hypothetical protein